MLGPYVKKKYKDLWNLFMDEAKLVDIAIPHELPQSYNHINMQYDLQDGAIYKRLTEVFEGLTKEAREARTSGHVEKVKRGGKENSNVIG